MTLQRTQRPLVAMVPFVDRIVALEGVGLLIDAVVGEVAV